MASKKVKINTKKISASQAKSISQSNSYTEYSFNPFQSKKISIQTQNGVIKIEQKK